MGKIKKGDEVTVITGRDKGKRAAVVKLVDDSYAIVEGVNMVKRHTKPNPQMGAPGGIIEKETAIHISNIGLFNPVTEKADRVGSKTLEDGKKVRIFKSNNEVVDI